jgi:CRP/FNR family transcriptional regulator
VTWSGDPNTLCANVVSGALKVTASTEDGREQIVGLLFQGDFAGQPFVEEAPLTITALAAADLCLYPRSAFERTLGEHPRLERLLLRRTMRSLDEARQRMLSLGRKNAQERIAGFLLEVIDRTLPEGAPAPLHIELPIGRGEMADFLGLTIETVSRQLTRMRSDGMIEFEKGDRSCTIVNRARLYAVAHPH